MQGCLGLDWDAHSSFKLAIRAKQVIDWYHHLKVYQAQDDTTD